MDGYVPVSPEAVRRMTMKEIAAIFREAARMQRANEGITYEHGVDLVNVIATHGDRIADAVSLMFYNQR